MLHFFDIHEGTGNWLAALATFAAVCASLGIAVGGWLSDRRRREAQEGERLTITTSRYAAHGCLLLHFTYHPRWRHSGIEVHARIVKPTNAYLVRAARRLGLQGDRQWMEIQIDRVEQAKAVDVPLDFRAGDPDEGLRGAVFVVSGPGDRWQIDGAMVELSVHQIGSDEPLTSFRGWVSPIGEDPRRLALERQEI
ncbi:hypothetical protein [Phenylobacterium sp.]|uniref:hypothetical protein n=1 Tax=Phenylobacterium sp. TaxID=1871053 RepID=UPI0025D0EBC1|nr:hypothetical protein [Phenylobacterium sp.]